MSARSNYEDLKVTNVAEGTDHFLLVTREKSSWRVVFHNLPAQLDSQFLSVTDLQESVRTYMMMLDNLQPFYSSLEMLDDICIVGDPQIITPKINWRLVKFNRKVFIKVEFLNPLCVDELSITFHGCTASVKEMTEIYNSKCDDFEDETIYNKLLCIFGIPYFPAKEEDTVDCSICLSYRCDHNRCPVVCCDNEKCDKTFHISCLETYFKVQKHVKILTIFIGECPFCKHTLSNSYAPLFQRLCDQEIQE